MAAEQQSQALDGPPQLSGRWDDMDIDKDADEIIIFDTDTQHAWIQSDDYIDAQEHT